MIEATLFEKPQGGMRGVLIGTLTCRGKVRRVAHAYLFDDSREEITASLPSGKMTSEELGEFAELLVEFRRAIKEPARYVKEGI